MKRTISVLLLAMGLTACDAVHSHVRAVVRSHSSHASSDESKDPGTSEVTLRIPGAKQVAAFLHADDASAKAGLGGKWQMTMETPHGVVKGPMEMKQDGAKLLATWEPDQMGPMKIAGAIDGKKVSFTMEAPGGGNFGFKGTVDGKKMSGETDQGGPWSATR